MRKAKTIYKFEKDETGYTLIAQADLIGHIDRILKKVKVKGKRKDFELIYVKTRLSSQNDGYYLIARRDLDFREMSSFICYHSNGVRSVQWHDYRDDLLDEEILDDLGMTVLTYKYYYSGNDKLADKFYPVLKENVTDELLEELKNQTEKAIAEAKNLREYRAEQKNLYSMKWQPV